MTVSIYLDARFERYLNQLRRSGKKGAIAADKAEHIIERLRHRRLHGPPGNKTKYGELRVAKCVKYDLGSGHRLISIRKDDALFMCFAGTHDQCHRWLEHNKHLSTEPAGKFEELSAPLVPVLPDEEPPKNSELRGKADDLQPHISDEDLRFVFRGLCERQC